MKDLKDVSNWIIKKKKERGELMIPIRLAITSGTLQR